ncbi:MAG: hypothetical protein C0615_08165 [Desulfuromonas sp.]|nr:MAG: hypothetical protein C0615_08165 [Desulfuromonas sp.]
MEQCRPKKHPCPDCKECLWCADTRCRLCRQPECHRKLSCQEQIELYERLNRESRNKSEE